MRVRELGRRSLKSLTASIGLIIVACAAPAVAQAASWAWSQPIVAGTSGLSPLPVPQVGANPAGKAVVVWADAGIVRAAVRNSRGTWTSPVSVSSAGETASSPVVAVGLGGASVVVWAAQRAHDAVVESSTLTAGVWSAPVLVSAPGLLATVSPKVAVDGNGQLRAVWVQRDTTRTAVVTATQTIGGTWSLPQTLSGSTLQPIMQAVVAVNPSGATVVGWTTGAQSYPHTGQVVTRSAGGSFGAPVTLVSTGGRPIQIGLNSFQVAIDATGVATAAWTAGGGGAAASSQSPSGAWNPPFRFPGTSEYRMSLAVDGAGTALVAWVDAAGLVSASRPAGGAWTAPVIVSAGADPYPAGPALAANGSTIFAAWDDLTATPRPVVASSWSSATGWAPATTLDSLTQLYGYTTLSASPLGTGAIVAWQNPASSGATIKASVFQP